MVTAELTPKYTVDGFSRVTASDIGTAVSDEWFDNSIRHFSEGVGGHQRLPAELLYDSEVKDGSRYVQYIVFYSGHRLRVSVVAKKNQPTDNVSDVSISIRQDRPEQYRPLLGFLGYISAVLPKQPNFLSRFVKDFELPEETFRLLSERITQNYMQIHNRIM